jgi:hypothetical protein
MNRSTRVELSLLFLSAPIQGRGNRKKQQGRNEERKTYA